MYSQEVSRNSLRGKIDLKFEIINESKIEDKNKETLMQLNSF